MRDERSCFLEAKAKFESCVGKVVRLAVFGEERIRERFFVVSVEVQEPGDTLFERQRRSIYPGYANTKFTVLTVRGQVGECRLHHTVDFQIVD